MAKKKKRAARKSVSTIRHQEATRKNIPTAERKAWIDRGRGLLVGDEDDLFNTISESQKAAPASAGSQTVFMDLSGGGDVSLKGKTHGLSRWGITRV